MFRPDSWHSHNPPAINSSDLSSKEETSLSELFYGYDLSVTGHTKSFAEETAVSEDIEYRFMIPESIVSKYKDKDISGQQVLDSSIILMDDERVEFRLQ